MAIHDLSIISLTLLIAATLLRLMIYGIELYDKQAAHRSSRRKNKKAYHRPAGKLQRQ